MHPNILSEIIELQENGGGGGNLTRIPNFTFGQLAIVQLIEVGD